MKTKITVSPTTHPFTVSLKTVMEKEGIYQSTCLTESRLVTIGNGAGNMTTFYCNFVRKVTESLDQPVWKSSQFIVLWMKPSNFPLSENK